MIYVSLESAWRFVLVLKIYNENVWDEEEKSLKEQAHLVY